MAPSTDTTSAAPRPTLSVLDAIAIIVGVVIGAGIFETPALVAANARSENLLLFAWVAGGIASFIGALCYAELATAYPHPGGNYHYLMRAFGSGPAFLFAWARLAVIQTGSIAMLSFVFGDYASQLLRTSAEWAPALLAVLAVVTLTAVNMLGVRQGARTQNLLTLLTVGGLALVIVVGLTATPATQAAQPVTAAGESNGAAASPAAAFGMIMIFVLLTFGGWNEAAFISAEVRNVRRNMVRALVGGIAIITVVYLLVNLALVRGLGLEGMAGAQAVAAQLMRARLGEAGAIFISLMVAVAALGSINGTVITGARTNFALGRDYPLFARLGRWNREGETPRNALLIQGMVALALVLFGTWTRNGFRTMVEYTTPVFWTFFLLTAISLMVLRVREPHVERPFKVPLYPLTPILFIAISAYMLYASVTYTGVGALVGVVVLLVGAPLLLVMPRRTRVEHIRGAQTALAEEREAA